MLKSPFVARISKIDIVLLTKIPCTCDTLLKIPLCRSDVDLVRLIYILLPSLFHP